MVLCVNKQFDQGQFDENVVAFMVVFIEMMSTKKTGVI